MSINAAFLLRSFHYNTMKNLSRAALDENAFEPARFLACFLSLTGSETELIYFSLMDFADASEIFRHSTTELYMQGLTAATLEPWVELF